MISSTFLRLKKLSKKFGFCVFPFVSKNILTFLIWYFVVLYFQDLWNSSVLKIETSFPFCLIGDSCFVEYSIVEVYLLVVEKREYNFLFLEQSINLLKIDCLLVLWRFLIIDWWRHHFCFCLLWNNWEDSELISILKKI